MQSFIRLTEANKQRFVDIIYSKFFYQDMMKTSHPDCPLPPNYKLLEWLNSSASDKYHIDWNLIRNGDFDEICRVFSCYYDYIEEGGSIKNKKFNTKLHPIELFKNAKLHNKKVNFAASPKEVNKETDLAYLCENDEFLFIYVLSHKGANWCNTFDCGGQGARWCIGYEQTSSYWLDYLRDGDFFILAFDKDVYRKRSTETDTLKYMIQLRRNSTLRHTKAWLQTDESEDTIPATDFEVFFDITFDELNELLFDYDESIKKYELDYVYGNVYGGGFDY